MDSYYAVCSSIYEFKARLDRIDYLFSFYGIYNYAVMMKYF